MKKSKKKTINYYSPHPVKECYSNIKKSLPKIPRYSLMPPETPVIGELSPDKFRIFKKIPAYNIFQTGLKASFKTYNGGTLIHGKMGLLPFVKYSLSLVFSIFFSVPIFFLFSSYFESKPMIVSGALITAIILFLIIVLSEAFEKLSWYCSHGEAEFLKKFLIDLLDAKEI